MTRRTSRSYRPRSLALFAATGLLAVAGLSACGGDDDTNDEPATTEAMMDEPATTEAMMDEPATTEAMMDDTATTEAMMDDTATTEAMMEESTTP
ncbi:MAG: hypothetical protein AB7L17_14985 [Ilumatobacteraceae bacterium]